MFVCILGLSLSAFMIALVLGHTYLMAYKNGMISRIAMTGVIYQKILSLSQMAMSQLSVGRIINMASNDVQRLDLVSTSSLFYFLIFQLLLGSLCRPLCLFIQSGSPLFIWLL